MRSINLLLLSVVPDDEFDTFESVYSCREKLEKTKVSDRKGVREFIKMLTSEGYRGMRLFEGFFFSFSINQISKEFDLLKISDDLEEVVNIELKSQSIDVDKMEEQLVKNKYYLNAVCKNIHLYSIDLENKIVYLLDDEDKPIPFEILKVQINDHHYKGLTDPEGFLRLDLKLPPDTYNIKTTFEGNARFKPISKKSKLEVRTRNIDRDVMIEVNHLAMEFKVSKDKIDTLKEYVIRTLKRTKKDHEKIRILDDVSFKIYEGERVGILGFNGAGKSTLLRIIAGIYEPTEGEIKINGKIAPLLELSAGFDKNYTGKNNVFLNGALLSMDENFIKEKYDEIVEFSELGEHINYPVKNYSKGMRAKLGFSIATLINPEILIIDEILAVGDIKFRKKSSEKIRSIKSKTYATDAYGLKMEESIWKGKQGKFVTPILNVQKNKIRF